MTFEQLSRETGKSPALLHRYSKRGMPMTSGSAALAWMAENVRAKVSTKPAATKPAPSKPADAPLSQPSGYMDARTSRERAEAEHAQIRVLEARGSLVHRDRVKAEVSRHLVSLRDSLLQIPARLQSVLAAESDEAKVHDILQDELYLVLGQIVEAA